MIQKSLQMPAFNNDLKKRDLKSLKQSTATIGKGGNCLDPSLVSKMTEVVGSSIDYVLADWANKQPNLHSESTRIEMATEILDVVIRRIKNNG